MSIVEKLKEATIPSIYSSVASLGLFYLMVDNNVTLNIAVGNMQVPIWAAVTGTAFIGSEIGMLLTEFIGDKIPVLDNFESVQKTIVPAALSGLSTYLVMRTLISADIPLKDSLIVGAGGNLIGQTLYDNMK